MLSTYKEKAKIVNEQVKKAKETMYQTMHDWFDDSIIKQFDHTKRHSDGLYWILPDDASDIKKYKSLFNVLTNLEILTSASSPIEIIRQYRLLVENLKNLELDNLSDLTEIFSQNSALISLFQQGFEFVNSYVTQISASMTEQKGTDGSYLAQAIDQLKKVEQNGVSVSDLANRSLGSVANAVSDHYQKVTGIARSGQDYHFKLDDNGYYMLDENDPQIINTFKKSFNILFEIRKTLEKKTKLGGITYAMMAKELFREFQKSMEIYNRLDLAEYQNFKDEYGKSIVEILKANLLAMGPILQDMLTSIEVLEVKYRLKKEKLVSYMQPILAAYEQALENIGVKEEEKKVDFKKARQLQLQEYQKTLETEIENQKQHYQEIEKLQQYLQSAQVVSLKLLSAEKLIYIRDHLKDLQLPKELEKDFRKEIEYIIKTRAILASIIMPDIQSGGLDILPNAKLAYLKENICLTDLDDITAQSISQKIDDIIAERKKVTHPDYEHTLENEKKFLSGLSDKLLEFYKDNIELLSFNEVKAEDVKKIIDQIIASRKKQGWGEYFYQAVADAAAASLNMVKSVTIDPLTYLMGNPKLNKVYEHAQTRFDAAQGERTMLDERNQMITHHLDSLSQETQLNSEALNQSQETTVAEENLESLEPASEADKADVVVATVDATDTTNNSDRSPTVTESVNYKRKAADAVEKLTSARDTLIQNLENMLDPVIYDKIKLSEHNNYYTIDINDSKLVRNYKALLNIVNCIADLSKIIFELNKKTAEKILSSLPTIVTLLKNLRALGLHEIGQLNDQYANYSRIVTEQFNMLFENSTELRNLYSTTLESIQEQCATWQTTYNILMQGQAKNASKSGTEKPSKNENVGLIEQFQSGLVYLKSLNTTTQLDNNGVPATVVAAPTPVVKNESLEKREEQTASANSADGINYYEGYIKFVDDAQEKAAAIKDLYQSLYAETGSTTVPDKDGNYELTKSDTEYTRNIKSVLNSLNALDKMFIEAKKVLQKPYSFSSLMKLLAIIKQLSKVVKSLNEVSLQGTQKEFAKQLLESLRETFKAGSSSLQKLVCLVDKLELDFGLKPGSLLAYAKPVIESYEHTCRQLDISRSIDSYPYRAARIAALETEKQHVAEEMKRVEVEQAELNEILKIVNELQSSSADKIHPDKLVYLLENIEKLKLDSKTEHDYRGSLNLALIQAATTIIDTINLSGINAVSMDDLKILKDHLPRLDLDKPINDKLNEMIDAEINRRNQTQIENAETAQGPGWLNMLFRINAWIDPLNIAKKVVSSAQDMSRMAVNKTGFTLQGQVFNHTTARMQELTAKINGLKAQEEMIQNRIQAESKDNVVNLNLLVEEAVVMQQASGMSLVSPITPVKLEDTPLHETVDETQDSATKEVVANPRDPADVKHSDDDEKVIKAQEIVDTLNEYFEKHLKVLNRKNEKINSALTMIELNKELKNTTKNNSGFKWLGAKITKYKEKKLRAKETAIVNGINLIKKFQSILNDPANKNNPIVKLNTFGQYYSSDSFRRLSVSTDNKITALLKKSGYYFTKLLTLGKVSLFQQPQQRIATEAKRGIKSAEKHQILDSKFKAAKAA